MSEFDVSERPARVDDDAPIVRRRKRRVGILIDMTPMVDIAFLLLIFFMVTTVFRRPLAMEINMPESDAQIQVPESNVLTVYVSPDDSMRYKMGTETPAPIAWEAMSETLRINAENNDKLIVLVKIHREARYENMVEMMDTLEDASMERFSLVPMTDEEFETLQETP